MRVSVLVDNHPGGRFPAEHGLSYLIEYDDKKVLFDTGQSNMFLQNAEAMGVDLSDVDKVVLSHGHFDHGNGLSNLSGAHLLCHPGCFVKRYRKADRIYIGLKNTYEELVHKLQVETSAAPCKISEKIIFLGEIPRLTDFESRMTSFVFEDDSPDYVTDDSAVALILPEGLFVITGCGHSGIVNTLEHAKKVAGISKLYGIMGGFHLKDAGHQTMETIKYLKDNEVKNVYPSHCTELPALCAFYESFHSKPMRSGDIYNFSISNI